MGAYALNPSSTEEPFGAVGFHDSHALVESIPVRKLVTPWGNESEFSTSK